MTAADKPEGLIAGGEQVRAQASEHIPTPEGRGGEREPTAAELDELADIIDEAVGEGHRDLELAVWKFVASRLSSPRVEEVRRKALEEAAALRGLISEMLEYRVVDESWEARAIRALSPPVG